MSLQKLTDAQNSGYVSSEETDSLLASSSSKSKVLSSVLRQTKMSSANGPTSNMNSASSSKPTLIRQDRTSAYLTSPQLSQQTRVGSDESVRGTGPDEDIEQGLRPMTTVPDIEVHGEEQEEMLKSSTTTTIPTAAQTQTKSQSQSQAHYAQQPTISITNLNTYQPQDVNHPGSHPNLGTSYQNFSSSIPPNTQNRCRACRNCSRRASTTPVSITANQMDRSASRDSVKSALQQGNLSNSMVMCTSSNVPPVLITSSPTNGSRIIRQSSQPESSTSAVCCVTHSACGHSHTVPNVSLKQLRTENQSEGIAGIAADSLRINGGMRPFKQGVLLMPRTLSESRKLRLRRAFTEATSESIQCSKLVFKSLNVVP